MSCLSVNDKGDNGVKPWAVHRSTLQLRKSLLRDHLMKAVQPVSLKWGPLPPIDVSRIAQHVRKKKMDGEGFCNNSVFNCVKFTVIISRVQRYIEESCSWNGMLPVYVV